MQVKPPLKHSLCNAFRKTNSKIISALKSSSRFTTVTLLFPDFIYSLPSTNFWPGLQKENNRQVKKLMEFT